MARKKGAHYVDNAKFLQAMKDWKEQCKDAEEAGDETPRISDYIGECFLKIVYNIFITSIQKNLKIHLHILHK